MIYLKISKELRAKLDAESDGRMKKKSSAVTKNTRAAKKFKTVKVDSSIEDGANKLIMEVDLVDRD